ncbi:hypothetical protein [Sulfuriroseicoccus oceanibius]|uniref:Uncharacterized protein n=1 Tax=Sulfuriroseicoccus oceanibius TaxID=2707525 RepID=A0A6B3L8N6_9BACT|nr:hypothetical protein [Sulfuriroseicoccus oceanibius]QQL43801.1 hypothetical protein G3M56_007805 [Sulfuriroseicoccus oceanibius]
MTQSSDSESPSRDTIKPQPRGIDRPQTPGIPARPIDAPRSSTQYAPIEPERSKAPLTPQSTTASAHAAPDVNDAEEADDEVAAPRTPWSLREKLTAIVIVAVIVLCGGMLAPGWFAPGTAEPRIIDEPELPLQHGQLTLTAASADWATLDENGKPNWEPSLQLEVAPGSSGVLRVFFYDVNGRQKGDTLNLVVRDGAFTETGNAQLTTRSTAGIDSMLVIKDVQVRGDEFWSVRVMSGPSTRAGIDEFTEMTHLRIPWDIQPAATK